MIKIICTNEDELSIIKSLFNDNAKKYKINKSIEKFYLVSQEKLKLIDNILNNDMLSKDVIINAINKMYGRLNMREKE